MTKDKLTSGEILQCYRNARRGLTPKDRLSLDQQSELLRENLRVKNSTPFSEYARMEILAKLGMFLAKKIPPEENYVGK